jgi:hypothetical protein
MDHLHVGERALCPPACAGPNAWKEGATGKFGDEIERNDRSNLDNVHMQAVVQTRHGPEI